MKQRKRVRTFKSIDELDQPFFSKELIRQVATFRDAIRVQNDSISCLQVDLPVFESPIAKRAQDSASLVEASCAAAA